MFQGIVMFSGGLDSTIVAHLLKSQGVKIKALHFVLPFYSGVGFPHNKIKESAESLNVPLQIVEEGSEYLDMIRNPYFGFGKNANPCVDCRIHRLQKAKKIMELEGASFIATGEVAGQRPMSQGFNTMNAIEKRAGVKGLLLRPLSAQLFPPSQAEINGIIDREKMLNWSGRGRFAQLEYAKKHNLKYASPAGGCILTTVDSSRRFHEYAASTSDLNLNDFKLLAYGRHFRISPATKFIVSRNETENSILLQVLSSDNTYLQMVDSTGPVGIVRGKYTEKELTLCGTILSRFSKEKLNLEARIALMSKDTVLETFTVIPAVDENCDVFRI